MTIDFDKLWPFELRSGASKKPSEGACLMDAVSWFEYGHLGDEPACVSYMVAKIGILVNDWLYHQERQQLKRFIPLVVGTNTTPEHERLRLRYVRFTVLSLVEHWSPHLPRETATEIRCTLQKFHEQDPLGLFITLNHLKVVCRCGDVWYNPYRPLSNPVYPYGKDADREPFTNFPQPVFLHHDLPEKMIECLEVICHIGRTTPVIWNNDKATESVKAFQRAQEVV